MTPHERKLNQSLRMLADAGPRDAPDKVEQALLTSFRTQQRKRKNTLWRWAGFGAAAVAASLALVILLRPAHRLVLPPSHLSPQASWQAQARPTQAPAMKVAVRPRIYRARKASRPIQEAAEFYVLPDADTNIPLEHATVVRVQMPMSDLRGFGLPINEQRASDRVRADVLLGQDGMARAVRFVQ